MSRLRTTLALLPLLLAGASQAAVLFTADLTHAQETTRGALLTSTGDPRPLSFGAATLTLNDAQTELALSATIFNIDVTGLQTPDNFDNLTAAHIHVGAPPGSNAPVRWGFFGLPDNDNNPDNLIVTPFATGVGGTFSSIWNLAEGNAGTTLTSNLPGIFAGLAYINFHTVQFPGGEVRGQITVPEPSGGLLLGSALAALVACRRRRHGADPAALRTTRSCTRRVTAPGLQGATLHAGRGADGRLASGPAEAPPAVASRSALLQRTHTP